MPCPECGYSDSKFEEWAPYRWLWTRVGGEPWTWIMRKHPKLFFAALIPLMCVGLAWAGKKRWSFLACFAAGVLTGHVWW